jgi:hypothetical protein
MREDVSRLAPLSFETVSLRQSHSLTAAMPCAAWVRQRTLEPTRGSDRTALRRSTRRPQHGEQKPQVGKLRFELLPTTAQFGLLT